MGPAGTDLDRAASVLSAVRGAGVLWVRDSVEGAVQQPRSGRSCLVQRSQPAPAGGRCPRQWPGRLGQDPAYLVHP